VPFKDKSGSCCQGDSRCSANALTRKKAEPCSECIALGSTDSTCWKATWGDRGGGGPLGHGETAYRQTI